MSTLPRAAGIYCIRNTVSGNCYVGSSVNMHARRSGHISALNRGNHHAFKLQRAWDKHGEETFAWEVLELVDDVKDLMTREQAWLDAMRPEYNSSPLASGGTWVGKKLSAEHRAHMSEAHRGKKQSTEWAAKRAAVWVGRKHTEETRRKMRKPKDKKRAPMSEEHKAKIAAALRGKTRSPEHCANLSAAIIAHNQRKASDRAQTETTVQFSGPKKRVVPSANTTLTSNV